MIDANSIRPGTVNVLIGVNGSGKSRRLRDLCISFLGKGDNVIAIAPSIYDRFRNMPQRGLRFFGARQGRAAATKVIRSALERASLNNPQIFKNLTQALAYTHFEPVIGIGISNLTLDNLTDEMAQLSRDEVEELRSVLTKWQSHCDNDGIVRLKLDSYSFQELDSLTFAILARYDDLLYKKGIAARLNYYLYRDGKSIPLLEACSGEICFITTMAYISAQIDRHSVIAIDEPDTSLHPTWQQNYVRTLLDLFQLYEPRIIISTHSPIIISGAEAAQGKVSVYEMKNGEAHLFDHAKFSLEEMYDRLFGLITPKNHYLSQRAVSMMNALNAGDRNLNQVVRELEELREKSYDESQKEIIAKYKEMARRLASIKQKSAHD